MFRKGLFLVFVLLSLIFTNIYTLTAQTGIRSLEVSDADGIPVLVKHLPQWEEHRQSALVTNDLQQLKNTVGQQPVLDRVEFIPGTEAVTAPYDAGRLVVIEYPSPQWSTDIDNRVNQFLAESGSSSFVYRRIGNYNAFVFEPTDTEAASALLQQVKYEKNIQWLGKDPFAQNRAERHFVITTSDIFLSTVLVILLGMGLAIVGGIATGYLFFRARERQRSEMKEFSDAGGMVRLNLDSLTPDLAPGNLLRD